MIESCQIRDHVKSKADGNVRANILSMLSSEAKALFTFVSCLSPAAGAAVPVVLGPLSLIVLLLPL